ncbi:MAG: Swt1 family HEPN domain-containing protein [Pseudomonadota bacterium]
MANRLNDHIRSFGMSGYLVTEELHGVEKDYSLNLGHSGTDDGEQHYYPQFEESIRTEAAEMAMHYETFYCLEQSIRKLIVNSLFDAEGSDWWASARIPEDIFKRTEKLIQKELDSGITRRSELPIDYTTFGELSVIITFNWDVFGAIFRSPRAVENVMSSLNLLRGPIAHCSPMMEDEIDRLRLAVKDWFRIMA